MPVYAKPPLVRALCKGFQWPSDPSLVTRQGKGALELSFSPSWQRDGPLPNLNRR